MRLTSTSLTVLLLTGTTAAASASGNRADRLDATVSASMDQGGRKERLICRREAEPTSRVKAPRICKTAEQWRREDRS